MNETPDYKADILLGFYIQRRSYGSKDPNGDTRLESNHYRAADDLQKRGLVKIIQKDGTDPNDRPYIGGELTSIGMEHAIRLLKEKKEPSSSR
jgi:hypothetical protein